MKTLTSLLVSFLSFGSVLISSAATISWDGGGGDNVWQNRTNWSGDQLPGADDEVVISVGGSLTVLSSGSVTIRHLTCDRSLTLSNGNFTVTAGASQVLEQFTLLGLSTVTAQGSTASLRALDTRNGDQASLVALGGGQLRLEGLSNYQKAAGCSTVTWRATGAGSVLELPGLTNLVGGNCGALALEAMTGGQIRLTNAVVADGVITVTASGSNSVVHLASLRRYLHSVGALNLSANSGGMILMPVLADLPGAVITLGAGGFLNTAQITNLNGSALTVNGGALLSLPGLRSVVKPSGCNETRWQASGAGSVLEAPGLTNLVGGDCGGLTVEAEAGGQILLTNVMVADRVITITAGGSNSVVNLASLRRYLDSVGALNLSANSGGTILMPVLADLPGAVITLGAGGFLNTAQITNLNGTALTVNGGAHLSLPSLRTVVKPSGCNQVRWLATGAGSVLEAPGLTNLVGGDCGALALEATAGGQILLTSVMVADRVLTITATGSNSVVNLASLRRYLDSVGVLSLSANSGGTILVPVLADLPGATALTVNGGARLSLPSLKSVIKPSGCSEVRWQASGAGSVLELPGLTNLVGGDCGALALEATAGGQILLTNATAADRVLTITATGSNSVVNLASLRRYLDSVGALSLSANSGGMIFMPVLADLPGAAITLGAEGFLNTAQITNLNGTALTVNGGARLSLPSLRSVAKPSGCNEIRWQASGAGSVLEMPGLTNLVGGDCGTLALEATAGGQILLTNLLVTDRFITITATGSNSVVNLASLRRYLDSFGVLSLSANSGGMILMPVLTDLPGADITLGAGGFLNTTQITNLNGTALTVNGGARLSLPGLKSVMKPNGCNEVRWQASGAGSVLELPGLTNLVGGDCGTLTVEAASGGQILLTNATVADRVISITASGSNSVVNLASLRRYLDSLGVLNLSANNGGTIFMPVLADLPGAAITLGAGGFLNTAQITNLNGTALTVNGGAHLSLPSLTSVTKSSGCNEVRWQVNGAGSVLEVPGLTALIGGDCGTLVLQANTGGRLLLTNLLTMNRRITVTAEGSNSVVSLSGLRTLNPATGPIAFQARNAGRIDLRALESIGGAAVSILADGAQATVDLRGLSSFTARLGAESSLKSQSGGMLLLNSDAFLLARVAIDVAAGNPVLPPVVVPSAALTLYGRAWHSYWVEVLDLRVPDGSWSLFRRVALTNAFQAISGPPPNHLAYRVHEFIANPPYVDVNLLGPGFTQPILFGVPFHSYLLQSTNRLPANPAPWPVMAAVTLTNSFRIFPSSSNAEPHRFYQALEP